MGALLLLKNIMLVPKKTKFKKQQKGKNFRKVKSVLSINRLHFGSVSLKSVSTGVLSSKQIEAMGHFIRKSIKKIGRVTINLIADTPITKKPIEVRMGKGKGNVSHWVCKVQVGTILCEIETLMNSVGLKALRSVQFRLPFKTKIFTN
jgi:large subunit ribosomal protein L16